MCIECSGCHYKGCNTRRVWSYSSNSFSISEYPTDTFVDFCKAPGEWLSDVLRKGGRVPQNFLYAFQNSIAEEILNQVAPFAIV